MRLSTYFAPFFAAAALLSVPGAAQAAACGGDGRAFPLITRVHGGPGSYEAGGGYGTWFLDLRNTTDQTCEDVHPVVVLVDDKHALRASQPRLEFYAEGRPHPVRFETTDRDELVGVFDGGVPGLTIGPRQTRTVQLRLSVASDAVTNGVTATAALVQRRDGDDGEWIGQSNEYRFRIDGRGTDGAFDPQASSPAPDPARPQASSPASPPDSEEPFPDGDTALPTAPPGRQSLPDELARTGQAARAALGATALLLAAGCALVLARRRR